MRFVISRTSKFYNDDIKPCEEAYRDKLTRVDIRNVDDPKRLKFDGDRWFEVGTNHRVIDGKIARDMGEVDMWFIDINSLEELVAFKNKYGEEIVLTTSLIDGKSIEIEIYDTYRE